MHLSPYLAHRDLLGKTFAQMSQRSQPVIAWQSEVRVKLVELLQMPQLDAPDPNARSIWKRDTEYGTIEKIVFAVEPTLDAVAYWCVPHNATRPLATYICLQGHTTGMHHSISVALDDESQPIEVVKDRDFAIGCMKRGMAALCLEQRSFGYRREAQFSGPPTTPHTCGVNQSTALLLGRTLIGERVWDVDRAIDYLWQRGDVDMDRLGIMGNSGGGTTSIYATAVLDRIKRSIVSCAFARFADSILAMPHCVCNVVPGIVKWLDMGDIAGLAAPKPMVIVSGVDDTIFPIASSRQEFARAQTIYHAAGAGDRIKFVQGPEGHRFYADLAWSAMQSLD